MDYALLLFVDEKKSAARPPEEARASVLAHVPYIERLKKNGHMLGTGALEASREGRTLRNERGRVVVTDGPFAETREVLGGYYMIRAADLDQAIALARECPALRTVNAAVEIRPLVNRLEAGWGLSPPPPGADRDWGGAGTVLPPRFLVAVVGSSPGGRGDVGGARVALLHLAPAGSATTLRLGDGGALQMNDGAFMDAGADGGPLTALGFLDAVDVDGAVEIARPWLAVAAALEVRRERVLPPEVYS